MKVRAIGITSNEEMLNELDIRKSELWSERKFYLLRDFLLIYLAIWIGCFVYSFCQHSFKYFIKTFKLSQQLPALVISFICLIIWVYVVYIWIKEANKRESLIHWMESYDDLLILSKKLNKIENFKNFELFDDKIKLNYLTNGILSSINISRDKYFLMFGEIKQSDTYLVLDFGNKIIYSTME